MNNSSLHRFNEILRILKNNDLLKGITPEKLCKTLEQLGPTFIKIGQILSTRVDLLPIEYCDELSKLRSNVTPIPYEEIEEILKKHYKNIDDIFLSIEKVPIGSASIAQVHKAVLKENKKQVVIKVKRPGIENLLETDIQLFKKAVNLLHLNKIVKVMDLNDILDQLYEVTKQEINFNIETSHLIEFRNKNEKCTYISSPYVYSNLCSDEIIVMEYVDGIKINDIGTLRNKNYNLVAIANLLSKNYVKQAIEDGFFHADPHPDNILIKNNNIVYIDFGMMGRLLDKNKQLLKKCIKAIIIKDYKEVSRILVSMSIPLDEVDIIILENDVSSILEEFGNLELESISTSKFISDMFNMLRKNHLVLDKDVTMLIRGIGIIEPVLKSLNPQISLLKVLIQSEKINVNSMLDTDKIKDKSRKMLKNVSDIADIPSELSSLLKAVNNGDTKFKIELSDSAKHVDKLENLVHEIILGFVDGCLIIATVLTSDNVLKSVFLFLVIVVTLYLIIKMIIDIIHRGY